MKNNHKNFKNMNLETSRREEENPEEKVIFEEVPKQPTAEELREAERNAEILSRRQTAQQGADKDPVWQRNEEIKKISADKKVAEEQRNRMIRISDRVQKSQQDRITAEKDKETANIIAEEAAIARQKVAENKEVEEGVRAGFKVEQDEKNNQANLDNPEKYHEVANALKESEQIEKEYAELSKVFDYAVKNVKKAENGEQVEEILDQFRANEAVKPEKVKYPNVAEKPPIIRKEPPPIPKDFGPQKIEAPSAAKVKVENESVLEHDMEQRQQAQESVDTVKIKAEQTGGVEKKSETSQELPKDMPPIPPDVLPKAEFDEQVKNYSQEKLNLKFDELIAGSNLSEKKKRDLKETGSVYVSTWPRNIEFSKEDVAIAITMGIDVNKIKGKGWLGFSRKIMAGDKVIAENIGDLNKKIAEAREKYIREIVKNEMTKKAEEAYKQKRAEYDAQVLEKERKAQAEKEAAEKAEAERQAKIEAADKIPDKERLGILTDLVKKWNETREKDKKRRKKIEEIEKALKLDDSKIKATTEKGKKLKGAEAREEMKKFLSKLKEDKRQSSIEIINMAQKLTGHDLMEEAFTVVGYNPKEKNNLTKEQKNQKVELFNKSITESVKEIVRQQAKKLKPFIKGKKVKKVQNKPVSIAPPADGKIYAWEGEENIFETADSQ